MSIFEKDYQSLKDIDGLLKCVSDIVLNLAGNSQTLNALNLDRINIEALYKFVPPEMQVSYSFNIGNALVINEY